MHIESRALDRSFAREVVGLRLWEPVDDQTINELRDLWAHHPLLVFRRQALSEDELAGFSALFGPLERIVRTDWASPVRPEVGVISNLKDGPGKPIGGLGDGVTGLAEIFAESLRREGTHRTMPEAMTGQLVPARMNFAHQRSNCRQKAGQPPGLIYALSMRACPISSSAPSRADARSSITPSGFPAIRVLTG